MCSVAVVGVCSRGTNEVQQTGVSSYESQRSDHESNGDRCGHSGELESEEGGLGTDSVTFTRKEKVSEEAIREEARVSQESGIRKDEGEKCNEGHSAQEQSALKFSQD